MTSLSLLHRPRQGLKALFRRSNEDVSDVLANLTTAQQQAFRALPHYDQVHLRTVYVTLIEDGERDDDLLLAALLHDIGKVGFGTHVRLVDRVATVLLRRLAPSLLARLARLPASGWRRGLALSVHHPELGAALAASLGCSRRTCWLI